MKFSIPSQELEKTLKTLLLAEPGKTTIPVLAHVLLDGDAKAASMTDLELSVKIPLTGTFTDGKGRVCVPARKLYEIVRLMDGDITVEALENHWVRIKGGGANIKLVGMSAENFPSIEMPSKDGSALPLPALQNAIERTAFAISREESRYTLSGALLEIEGDALSLIATDGHRLAIAKEKLAAPVPEKVSVLIPSNLVRVIGSLHGEIVQFSAQERAIFFVAEGTVLAGQKLTGQFPNYQTVLPQKDETTVKVMVGPLRKAIERAVTVADDRAPAVKLSVDTGKKSLGISARSGEVGESDESLELAEASGSSLEIAFNAGYLLEFLSKIPDAVTIGFGDSSRAGDFRAGDEYRYVVMPMRV